MCGKIPFLHEFSQDRLLQGGRLTIHQTTRARECLQQLWRDDGVADRKPGNRVLFNVPK
jgi:hypothetical protein